MPRWLKGETRLSRLPSVSFPCHRIPRTAADRFYGPAARVERPLGRRCHRRPDIAAHSDLRHVISFAPLQTRIVSKLTDGASSDSPNVSRPRCPR
jgi:hypothetical protein